MTAARNSQGTRDPHEIDTVPPPPLPPTDEDLQQAATKITTVSEALAADMIRARERFEQGSPQRAPRSGVRLGPGAERRVYSSTAPTLPRLVDLVDREEQYEPTIRHVQGTLPLLCSQPMPMIAVRQDNFVVPPPMAPVEPIVQPPTDNWPVTLLVIAGAIILCAAAMGVGVFVLFIR